MNNLMKRYLDFFMEEVLMERKSYYSANRKWTSGRIIGAAALAVGIVLMGLFVAFMLLGWMLCSPISFLLIVVLPSVITFVLYGVIKKEVDSNEG